MLVSLWKEVWVCQLRAPASGGLQPAPNPGHRHVQASGQSLCPPSSWGLWEHFGKFAHCRVWIQPRHPALLGCFHHKKEGRGWKSRNTEPGLQRWKSLLNSPDSCSGHASENCRRWRVLPSPASILHTAPLLRVWRLLCSFLSDDSGS